MTVILDYVTPTYLVSVSDRLTAVECRREIPSKAHEPHFNKTIYCITYEARVAINFTGIAYVGDLPTDDWIAQLILGKEIKRIEWASPYRPADPTDPALREKPYKTSPATMSDYAPSPSNLLELQRRLATGLREETGKNETLRKNHLTVHISGFKNKKNKVVLHNLVISKPIGVYSLCFKETDEWESRRNQQDFLSISGGWDKAEPEIISQLNNDLVNRPSGGSRPDEYVARVLVNTLRNFSSKYPDRIGSDAMVVRTNLTVQETVFAYDPNTPFEQNPGTTTPWLIMPGGYFAPTELLNPTDRDYPVKPAGKRSHRVYIKGTGVKATGRKLAVYFSTVPRRGPPR